MEDAGDVRGGRLKRSPDGIPGWAWALLIPAVALAAAYAYWSAFAAVYSIPRYLVSVQPSDALAAFAALGLVLLAFNGLVSLGSLLVPHLPWWVREPAANMLSPLVFSSLFALAVGVSAAWIAVAVVTFFFMGLSYLAPLWNQRDVEGYTNKLRADTERMRRLPDDEDPFGKSLISLFAQRFPVATRQLALAVLLVSLAWAAGLGSAYGRTSFLVASAKPEQLLVAVISDRAYLRSIDTSALGPLEVRPANDLPAMTAISVTHEQLKQWHVAQIP